MPKEDSGLGNAEIDGAFLRQVIDHVAHPVFVKDRAFKFVLVNRATADLSKLQPEDMVGKTDYDLFAKEHADIFRKQDTHVFATGLPLEIAAVMVTDEEGREYTFSTTKVPLSSPSGEITHLIGLTYDITRIKRAEDVLRLSNEELEARVAERTSALAVVQEDLMRKERLAVLGQLAGGVAHQIRNPLGTIKNAAYVLQRLTSGYPHPEIRQALEMIHDEVESANQTISALLDYARVRHAVRRRVALADIIDEALTGQNAGAKLTVVRELDQVPQIDVDAEQVRGALYNLIRNAIEAMPEGGTLTFKAWQEGAYVVLTVSDTGEGVPDDVRPRLFEPLVTTKALGLGLGLVTARTLVEGQGGTLRSVAAPLGALFELRLPVA